MGFRGFRLKLWPTLFTIPALIALLTLGTWQLQRLYWKEALVEKLQTRAAAPPVALPKKPADLADLDSLEYRRVRVSGTFAHEKEFHLVYRSLNGNPGVHVITPLIRADGDAGGGGGVILVSRGWVPFDKKEAANRLQGQIKGAVTIDGIVRLVKGQGRFTPDNEPKKNFWFFIDPPAMAAARGLPLQPNFYVQADNKNVPGGFPLGHQWTLKVRNDHLQYAITWYALAVALFVIFLLYHKNTE